MSDLAAEGDRIYADIDDSDSFYDWCEDNWPAIAAALRERDVAIRARDVAQNEWRCANEQRDALRVRAETAEAKSDEGWALVDELTEALARANRMMTGEDAAAVDGRHAD